MSYATQSYVIQIGHRYFYKVGKKGVLTAHSLAGAKHFHIKANAIHQKLVLAEKHGKKCEVRECVLLEKKGGNE